MTDFTSKNTVYYDVLQYNGTNAPIPANSDNKLIYPLFNDSNNYSVGIGKATFDLSTIPLTSSNIGLKLYQVGLKVGDTEETAYVRQVNANQDNFVWNCPKGSTTLTKYKYSSAGTITQISSQNFANVVNGIVVYNFVVDDYSNVFVAGSVASENVDTLFVIDENNNLLTELSFTDIKHIYIDRGQNLYVCDESETPTVYVYGMNNSIGNVNLTQRELITENRAGNKLVNLLFCVADGEIIVGYDRNTITLYNSSFEPQTDIQEQAITQLQNLANINATANTYVLSNSNALNDTLYGTNNNLVYNVNTDTQQTNGTIASNIAITSAYAFAVGTDNFTYATAYPFVNVPVNWSLANNSIGLKGIYSYQKLGLLYAIGNSDLYYGFNLNCGKNPTAVPNSWSEVGEFEISAVPQINPTNIDIQSTTNKIFACGSDDNLYVTSYATFPFELLFTNQSEANLNDSFIYGIQANNTSSLVRNFNLQSANSLSIFKQATRFWSAESSGLTNTLNIYDLNFNLLETNQNFDTNLNFMTYFKSAGYFAYQNDTPEVVVRRISNKTIVQSYPIPEGGNLTILCEVDSTHFAMIVDQVVYIFDYTSTNYITFIAVPNDAYDMDANQSDVVNGASSLFVLANRLQQPTACTQIYKITFTDNTYTTANAPSLVYTETRQNLTISYLECHQGISAIGFITANQTNASSPTNVSLNYLYSYGGYSTNNQNTTPININISNFNYGITKYQTYMLNSVSSSQLFTQVNTNGFQLSAVCVSRSNQNNLYAIGKADNKIYEGSILSNSVTFTLMELFQNETYNYLTSTPNTQQQIASTLYLYGLTSQNLITSLPLADECGAVAKNDVANQYMVSYLTQQKVQAFNASTFASQFTSNLSGAYRIMTKNGSDIDVGGANIFNISTLINAINLALVDATNKINQALGAGTIPTAPLLTLDYQTGLCTLAYPSVLAQSANGILFNQSLINLIYFQTVPDTLSSLLLLVLNPQAESITQTTKTIYQFNQLSRILFVSNTIFVVGNWYGINSFSHIITDIDVPVDQFVENLGQKLYYQPPFLRTFFMNSNLPLERIQLQILYEYRNGSQFQLLINPQQNMNCKLQFVKK